MTDRIFAWILVLCILAIIICGIAWALGWEYGAFGMIAAAACANLPMFHFAMHWPFREKKNSQSKD